MKIIDINILLYASDRLSPFHATILKWWEDALSGPDGIGLPWVTVLGFVRLMTNSRVTPAPLSVEEATTRVDEWLAHPRIELVQESTNHWSIFREIVEQLGGGNRTTDAHLAALAVSRGATLVSCDTGFSRIARLKWINPAN